METYQYTSALFKVGKEASESEIQKPGKTDYSRADQLLSSWEGGILVQAMGHPPPELHRWAAHPHTLLHRTMCSLDAMDCTAPTPRTGTESRS